MCKFNSEGNKVCNIPTYRRRPLSQAMIARLASPGNGRPPPISLPKITCLSKSIEPEPTEGGAQ
jgi:hypothetical protein